MANYVVRVARGAVLVALFLVAASAGVVTGVLFAYAGDLPQITALDDYAPSTITRIYAADGQPIQDFATERRLVVGYDDIAPQLRQAIIAAEDGDFDRHFGINISAIAVLAARDIFREVKDVVTGSHTRPAGASTITQQLARQLLPETVGFQMGDVSVERKIREALVAIQIEKRYTKREILTFYANHILFGHGTYGVEAASRLYFNKAAKDVSLEEAAMLAGIIQSPGRQSPFVNMDAAVGRRNYALQRMAEEGFITQAAANTAKKTTIVLRGQPQQPRSVAPYFVEEVRQHLEQKYGAKALYEHGLSVRTTLDVKMQEAANKAIDAGIRRVDKTRGFRRAQPNVVANGSTIDGFKTDRWNQPIVEGDIVPALVIAVGKPANTAQLKIGKYHADLTRDGYSWTRRTAVTDVVKAGDLIDVEVLGVDSASGSITVRLDQAPLVQGALVAIDNRTGQIRAMVGGSNFNRSKFNRAVQAFRQIGSTFKPIVYTAAIDRGLTPATTIVDEPVTYPAGNGQTYTPQNYDHKFEGTITLRHALEDSRNIPAIKTMALVGPQTVLNYAKRFGFGEKFPPYLPIALGAGDATLLDVTSAYTVFPNQGIRFEPYSIIKVQDRDGNLLEENRSEPEEAIRADTAYVMTSLLEGVVTRGTAAQAARLNWPLAGKTGTVDNNTDAWFIGFDPDITVGVWVGLDEKKPLGANETGAVAALPIWISFMEAYIASRSDRDQPPSFAAPGNIVSLWVDAGTGAVLPGEGTGAIRESFIAGTQPGADTFQRP
ncbi:MAG TPA: PBP1A family penicillin-binding protein [Vicinamibacterales bacterium]|nr:PBP1A family penicillin-binding protein [Vicinamibacterales bacterium]